MPTETPIPFRATSAATASRTTRWLCSMATPQRTGRRRLCPSSPLTSRFGTTSSITSHIALRFHSGAATVLPHRSSTSRATTTPTTPTLRHTRATTPLGRLKTPSPTTRQSASTRSMCSSASRLQNSRAMSLVAAAGISSILPSLQSTMLPATSFTQRTPTAKSPEHRHTSMCMAVPTQSIDSRQCLPA